MKLIIVADLGLLRAYREVKRPQDREPHLELIEELTLEAAHEKLSDQVTDQAGRFPRGSGADITTGDLSAGERLNLDAEQMNQDTHQHERNEHVTPSNNTEELQTGQPRRRDGKSEGLLLR